MVSFLGVLCLASLGSPGLDGHGAVARAERLLRQVGVRDQLSLARVANSDWSTKEPSWTVSFTMSGGTADVGLNQKTGLPNRVIVRSNKPEPHTSNQLPSPQECRRFREVLKILGYGQNISFASNTGFSGVSSVHLLVHGLPFFNLNPTYGPDLSMSANSGSMIFYASPPLPPVNDWRPRIDGPDALSMLKAWDQANLGRRNVHVLRAESRRKWVAELGYWKSSNEPKARLVWRATKFTTIQGKPYGLGSLRVFVDAHTGRLFSPEDPGWLGKPRWLQ